MYFSLRFSVVLIMSSNVWIAISIWSTTIGGPEWLEHYQSTDITQHILRNIGRMLTLPGLARTFHQLLRRIRLTHSNYNYRQQYNESKRHTNNRCPRQHYCTTQEFSQYEQFQFFLYSIRVQLTTWRFSHIRSTDQSQPISTQQRIPNKADVKLWTMIKWRTWLH